MTVDVAPGATFSAGKPQVVYEGRYAVFFNANTAYDVAKDGRFLRIRQVRPERTPDRIDLVVNWFTELARAIK